MGFLKGIDVTWLLALFQRLNAAMHDVQAIWGAQDLSWWENGFLK